MLGAARVPWLKTHGPVRLPNQSSIPRSFSDFANVGLIWERLSCERTEIVNFINANDYKNVGFLTGDQKGQTPFLLIILTIKLVRMCVGL